MIKIDVAGEWVYFITAPSLLNKHTGRHLTIVQHSLYITSYVVSRCQVASYVECQGKIIQKIEINGKIPRHLNDIISYVVDYVIIDILM